MNENIKILDNLKSYRKKCLIQLKLRKLTGFQYWLFKTSHGWEGK